MGQYFKIVNLSKKQYIHIGDLGENAKFSGLGYGLHSIALTRLLCVGGDGSERHDRIYGNKGEDEFYLGAWAGDQIQLAGDYAEPFEEEGTELNLYNWVKQDSTYEDIADKLIHWLARVRKQLIF